MAAGRRTLTRAQWLREMVRYCIAGFTGFAVDQGLFMILVNVTGVHYQILTMVTLTVGLVVNYALSKFWVWRGVESRSNRLELLLFLLVTAGGFAITGIGMHVLVEWTDLPEETAKLVMAALVFGYNYLVRKTVVFRAVK